MHTHSRAYGAPGRFKPFNARQSAADPGLPVGLPSKTYALTKVSDSAHEGKELDTCVVRPLVNTSLFPLVLLSFQNIAFAAYEPSACLQSASHGVFEAPTLCLTNGIVNRG